MSVVERNSLLERAWELRAERDYPGLVELLTPVPEAELLSEPELGYWLAAGWRSVGRWHSALGLLRDMEEPCRRRGNDKVFRDRLNMEAVVLLQLGYLAEAEILFNRLVEVAREAGDEQAFMFAIMNLGVVCDIQCRWKEALTNHGLAMAICQRLGDRRALGSIHNNLAMTCRQLALLHEADTHFQKALDHFRVAGSDDQIGLSEMERALLLNMMGDPHLAEATARRVLLRFRRLGHLPGEGDSLRVLGIVVAGQGRRDEARRYFQDAIGKVRSAAERLTEAQVLEEMAVLEREEGNEVASAGLAEDASTIYLELGAPLRAQMLRARLAGQEQNQRASQGA